MMCYHEVMVIENLRSVELGRQCEQVPMVLPQVRVGRDLYCQSHLVHIMDLREATLVTYHE